MKLRVAISTAHLAAEVSAGGGVVVLAVLARELLGRLRLPAPAPALPQQVGLQVVEHPDRGLHVTCHASRGLHVTARHYVSSSQPCSASIRLWSSLHRTLHDLVTREDVLLSGRQILSGEG